MSEAPQIVEVDLGAVQAVLARSAALLPKPDYELLRAVVEIHDTVNIAHSVNMVQFGSRPFTPAPLFTTA